MKKLLIAATLSTLMGAVLIAPSTGAMGRVSFDTSKKPLVVYAGFDNNPLTGVKGYAATLRTPKTTSTHMLLRGFDQQYAGQKFGSHVHIGPCSETASAGMHYTHPGNGPLESREIWLDFTVDKRGNARVTDTERFRIPDGAARSIVIHTMPTNPSDGTAGQRFGCLDMEL